MVTETVFKEKSQHDGYGILNVEILVKCIEKIPQIVKQDF